MTYTIYAYENGRNTDSAEADVVEEGVDFFTMEFLVADLKNAGFAVVVVED